MTEYRVFRLEYDQGDCNTRLDLGFIRKGEAIVEYKTRVWDDGSWVAFRLDYGRAGRWCEVNGICEEAEPVFFAALPKAQALAILKG
jgi:hypothetical protein